MVLNRAVLVVMALYLLHVMVMLPLLAQVVKEHVVFMEILTAHLIVVLPLLGFVLIVLLLFVMHLHVISNRANQIIQRNERTTYRPQGTASKIA